MRGGLIVLRNRYSVHYYLRKDIYIYNFLCFSISPLLNLLFVKMKGIWCLQIGVQLFLKWAIMQGVAMILQNRYQRQRLYTRIALGKVIYFTFWHYWISLLLAFQFSSSCVFKATPEFFSQIRSAKIYKKLTCKTIMSD